MGPSDKWSTTIHPRMVVHSEEDVNSEFIAMEEEDYERLRELASERVPDESEAAVEVSRNSFQSWTEARRTLGQLPPRIALRMRNIDGNWASI